MPANQLCLDIPQAAGKGTVVHHASQDATWGWGISPVQWAPISEELCTGLAELPPHHSKKGPRLPPGIWLRVSAGSGEDHIIVQLAPDMSADDEAQLHADAVELLNAALQGGRTVTGAPILPPRELLAAVQAEQQGGPPAVDPQPPAVPSAGATGLWYGEGTRDPSMRRHEIVDATPAGSCRLGQTVDSTK